MPDRLPEILAASTPVWAVGAATSLDTVHIHYLNLNYLGVGFGALSAFLGCVFYAIKIYRLLKSKRIE